MLRATDEEGNVLPEFEKVLDIDIKAAAEAALGKELTQNLLSVVFDYDGNLWFATGGFRIYPERQQQGVLAISPTRQSKRSSTVSRPTCRRRFSSTS